MLPSLGLGLLCGGKSSRYGSNKALILFNGEPLILRIVTQLKKLEIPLFLLTASQEEYDFLKLPYLLDSKPGEGPLCALVSAFEQSSYSHILLIACDLPNLNLEFLRELIDKRFLKQAVVPVDNEAQFLCAIYSREMLSSLQHFILMGGRSFKKYFNQNPDYLFLLNSKLRFYNINTAQDWEDFSCSLI